MSRLPKRPLSVGSPRLCHRRRHRGRRRCRDLPETSLLRWWYHMENLPTRLGKNGVHVVSRPLCFEMSADRCGPMSPDGTRCRCYRSCGCCCSSARLCATLPSFLVLSRPRDGVLQGSTRFPPNGSDYSCEIKRGKRKKTTESLPARSAKWDKLPLRYQRATKNTTI